MDQKEYGYVVVWEGNNVKSPFIVGVALSEKGWRKLVDTKFKRMKEVSFFPLELQPEKSFDDGAYIQIRCLESPSTNSSNGWFKIHRRILMR